uniref:hypothetical protein n=1 Tax=Clostridium sp. 12(A) TaxID=1163671 RepID=UPI000463938B|nr:hypothetical protein [Clostridium sp. 12(A)]
MKRKICPVCDLPVNEANFCARCKKIVRRPVIWEMNYYLNEKPPAKEIAPIGSQSNGTAEQPKRTISSQPVRTGSAQPAKTLQPARTMTPPRTATPPMDAQPPRDYIPSGSSVSPKKKVGRRFPVSIAGIITFLFIIAGSLPDIAKKADRFLDKTKDYEVSYPFDDSGFKDLKEEDVKAAGIPCNGYNHFPVSGKEIMDSMGQYIEANSYGFLLKPQSVYSDNYEMKTDSGSISYYDTVEGYYLEDEVTSQLTSKDEGYVYQYVEINYDTATGEMHDYISSIKDKEASLAYLEQFLKTTETSAQIPLEESSVPVIMEQVRGGLERGEETIFTDGIFSLYVYEEDDTLQVTVSYNTLLSTEHGET